MLLFEAFTGRAEIDDGQEHEDERLDRADEEDVEELPPGEHDDPEGRGDRLEHGRPRKGDVPEGEQEHHYQVGEDVAEEPEREAQRLGDLLDDVERCEQDPGRQRQLKRLGESAQVAAEPEHVDAVPLHDPDDRYRHRNGQVDVGCGGLDRCGQREEVEPVGEQHEDEDGRGNRRHESRVLSDHLLHQTPDVTEQQFQHHLQPPRLALPETVSDAKTKRKRCHNGDRTRDERVVVERAQERTAAHLNRGVRPRRWYERGNDHAIRNDSRSAATASTTCEPPKPRSTSQTLPSPKASPMATPIMLRVMIRSRLVASKGIGSAIRRAASAPLIEPMARPVASAPPGPACPRTIPTTAAMTAAPAQKIAALRTRRSAFSDGAGRGEVPSEITSITTALLGLSNQGNDINWTLRQGPGARQA